MSPIKNLVNNASRHAIHGASGLNSSSMLNFLLTFTRIVIVTILIVYLGKQIKVNLYFSNNNRKQLLQERQCPTTFDSCPGKTFADEEKGNNTRAEISESLLLHRELLPDRRPRQRYAHT